MTQIEEHILELLKQGLSYLQIQENLQVSSKTISAVKKEYFPQIPNNVIKNNHY
jgi:DNA-binding NarL/FixJ family response regulator